MIGLLLLGILLCLALSFFFSASEMAYSSCNRLRLENARDDGDRRAAAAVKICERFDRTLSVILIGNNLVNIASSSIGSVIVVLLVGREAAGSYAWIAAAAITVLVILFGETIPKILAKNGANRYALRYAYAIRALSILLLPVVWLVVGLTKLLTLGLKGEREGEDDDPREELSSIIETAEDEDVLDEDQSELVQAAIDFSDISASEVMTARVDMVALDIDDPWDKQLEVILSAPYTRIPVYRESTDNIIGILHLNRFYKALIDKPRPSIRKLLAKPCYVYKTMRLPAVMDALKQARQHLAVVTDEYGGTLGVLTMEDVLEQMVGEIWDDTDEVEETVVERPDGRYELDGDMVISEFLDLLEIREEDFEADSETVGGWAIEKLETFPKAGDSFDYEGFKVTVLETDGRRVEKLLVERQPQEETEH
ncbi:MAG: hemolysin family protein [Oscillospiraceae bacterium]|nr:hemolysin family protein [Oscillospiraceae bacterium]